MGKTVFVTNDKIKKLARRTARELISYRYLWVGLLYLIRLVEKIDVAVPEGEIRARKMELPSHAQWMPCWDGELLNC